MKIDANIFSRRIVAGAIVVVLVSALCWWLIPREPSFEGRTLSEWMMVGDDDNGPTVADAERAIRAMGNRAVETSLDWLAREDGWLKQEFVDLIHRQPYWEPDIRGASCWHYGAYEILRILGSDARPAVPELVMLTRTNSRTALRVRAISALRAMGSVAEDAIPALLVCLDDEERQVRMAAAMAMGSIGRRPEVAVPKLLACAQDANRFDVPILLGALCGFTNESARIVPVLETWLQQSATAMAAAGVLGRFGGEADWPLARALTNHDAIVRHAAAVMLIRSQRRRSESLSTNATLSVVSPAFLGVTLRDRTIYDGSRLTIARALALNLDHPNPELRHYFANLLLDHSDEAVIALPDVLKAMGTDDIDVAFRAWMVFDLMPLDEIEFASPAQ